MAYPSAFYGDPSNAVELVRKMEQKATEVAGKTSTTCQVCVHCISAMGKEFCSIEKRRAKSGFCFYMRKR